MIKGVFEAWRHRQPGEIGRRDWTWDFDLGLREAVWDPPWKGFVAVHRDASGGADGYVRYRADDKWERRQPRNTLTIDDSMRSPARRTPPCGGSSGRSTGRDGQGGAARGLGASAVAADQRPRASVSDVGDGLWVRLFDVPRALAARTYERATLWSSRSSTGRRQAAGGGSASRPRRTASSASTEEVAGPHPRRRRARCGYLGGARLRDAVLATGVDEHQPGALLEADALLRTLDEPWCSTFF